MAPFSDEYLYGEIANKVLAKSTPPYIAVQDR